MSDQLTPIKKWFQDKKEEIFKDYFSFLSMPSIGTDSDYKQQTLDCAKWVLDYLTKAGLNTELVDTGSFPLVYGESKDHDKNAPTLLLYGHYDVQPVDPLEKWDTDPFKPTEKNGQIFARGAHDDKGQIFYTMVALRYFLEHHKKYPVHIKVCIEGEEESSSVGLSKTLPSLKDKLKADYILAVDCGIPDENTPAINLGARGVCQVTMDVTGSSSDLHSGDFGGIAYNPLRAVAELIDKFWDVKGKVAVPHFYDDVKAITKEDKKAFIEEKGAKVYETKHGIFSFFNENGYSLEESNVLRPTLEINGIGGGYFGKGFKTVIPATVTVKISCRLVPDQNPKKILKELSDFIKKHIHKGMKVKLDMEGTGKALRCSKDSAIVEVATKAYEEVFKKPCRTVLMGGSIPILSEMIEILDADLVGIGLGLLDDNIHAPNEHFGKDRFEKGFLIISRILEMVNLEDK